MDNSAKDFSCLARPQYTVYLGLNDGSTSAQDLDCDETPEDQQSLPARGQPGVTVRSMLMRAVWVSEQSITEHSRCAMHCQCPGGTTQRTTNVHICDLGFCWSAVTLFFAFTCKLIVSNLSGLLKKIY